MLNMFFTNKRNKMPNPGKPMAKAQIFKY